MRGNPEQITTEISSTAQQKELLATVNQKGNKYFTR